MAHQVRWNNHILETFIKEGCLTDFQADIMKTRIKGMTITEQSLKFHCSKSTIEKNIARLKIMYDDVQKRNSELPPRRFSAKELYMDTH